jgi:hypothetical protein
MVVELTTEELKVVINALNFARNEWAIVNDDELNYLADQAEELETWLKDLR